MIYIGSKEQVEAYIDFVNEGSNFTPGTTTWSEPQKHPTQDLYKVKKHKDFESEQMQLVDKLPYDWKSDIEI